MNKKAFERAILYSLLGEKQQLAPKISGSGRKVMLADHFQLVERAPFGIVLAIEFAVAGNFDRQAFGKGVDDGRADPVQTARNLVGVAAELAAGVQHGHDHFQSGLVGIFRMESTGMPRPLSVTVTE